MTRLVRLSGNVLLALIVAGAVYAGTIVIKTKRDNAEAAAYTSEAVAAMAANWNAEELLKRAAPEWLSPADKSGLKVLFSRFTALGKLRSLHAPAGRVGNGAFPGTAINGTWAEYAVVGEFDAGPSEFRMVLKRVDDGWQVAAFQVRSEALAGKK
jgi:hypothetical protein